ncbi:hypothetical protein Pyn_04120 [Prunus yedoensis var. nudiflora]|uniref:Uncharacterized protein n=1 Tax=Prunus yedoensis var. nudiflora TaxID=2094558 RepID=A0A314YHL6_PRUYE|nr:hypothetical protein Pyn_04120 [Prunus yedoensis var. nudiflora]
MTIQTPQLVATHVGLVPTSPPKPRYHLGKHERLLISHIDDKTSPDNEEFTASRDSALVLSEATHKPPKPSSD